MTRDPFLRLALLALATAYAVGVWVVAVTLGPVAAGGSLVVGGLLAVAFTLEVEPPEVPRPSRGRTRRFGGPRPREADDGEWD